MKAADIQGQHSWRDYLNGPADFAALQRVRGIGPERAALLLRVYGSIDRFLQAEDVDVAHRTGSTIGPRLARTLQERCRSAGLHSDWTRLEALSRADAADHHGEARRFRWTLPDLRRERAALVRWTRTSSRSLLHRLWPGR